VLYIFTGNGKGKTTAALGQAVRAVGEGKRVLMIQFIKGPWKSGEDAFAKGLEPHFKLVKMGKGFVGIMGDTLPREEHVKAAEEALEYAQKEVESKNWDIVILDEVNNAVHLDLLSKEAALALIDSAKDKIEHLILTGRDAPPEFINKADLVTEMRDIKHPYNKGVKGRRGIEY
jgi:cob(I)alamin adenosyltransferase